MRHSNSMVSHPLIDSDTALILECMIPIQMSNSDYKSVNFLDSICIDSPIVKSEPFCGVYLSLGHLPHSCSPNTYLSIGHEGVLSVRATKRIYCGDVITRSWFDDLYLSYEERQEKFRKMFGDNTHCQCEFCQRCSTNNHEPSSTEGEVVGAVITPKFFFQVCEAEAKLFESVEDFNRSSLQIQLSYLNNENVIQNTDWLDSSDSIIFDFLPTNLHNSNSTRNNKLSRQDEIRLHNYIHRTIEYMELAHLNSFANLRVLLNLHIQMAIHQMVCMFICNLSLFHIFVSVSLYCV